jgi:hypothetical protein
VKNAKRDVTPDVTPFSVTYRDIPICLSRFVTLRSKADVTLCHACHARVTPSVTAADACHIAGVKRRFYLLLLDAVTFAHDCGNRFNRSRSCLSWEAARWRDPNDDLRE